MKGRVAKRVYFLCFYLGLLFGVSAAHMRVLFGVYTMHTCVVETGTCGFQ